MSTATQVKARPILFSAPMVRAILDGRKTMTRRLIKPQPEHGVEICGWAGTGWAKMRGNGGGCSCQPVTCPYGDPDDSLHLWVREAAYIAPPNFCDKADCNTVDNDGMPRVIGYAADMDGESVRCATDYGVKKTPSIFMPRWASRIMLEVTGVRVERVVSISSEDAIAEGFGGYGEFLDFFYTLNPPYNANPWVWVVEFGRVEP